MIGRNMAAFAALTVLSGCCATIDEDRVGFVTPWAAAGVISFNPEARSIPQSHAVNTKVARLLDRQEEHAHAEELVAAR